MSYPVSKKPGLLSSDPPPIAQSLTFLSSLSYWNVLLASNLFPIFPFTNFFLLTNPAFRLVTLLNPPSLRSSLTY
jgi:hypothetical protein